MNCRNCGRVVFGGKGDYWHVSALGGYGDMRCWNEELKAFDGLAYPEEENNDTR